MEKVFDCCIIGGGPAGAMAAALLAKSGFDIVLLEKEVFPRYQVGESLIPHFWKFADLIGASEDIEKAGFIRKAGGSALWDGKLNAMSFSSYGYTRPGLHVERDVFDQILLNRVKKLGGDVRENSFVSSISICEDINEVHYTREGGKECIKSRFLIDASGQSALVSKQLGLREFDPEFRFQAFWAYFDKGSYLNKEGKVTNYENRFQDNPYSLISGTKDWGWTWHLMMKDKLSIGTMVSKSQLKNFKSSAANLEGSFLKWVSDTPLIGDMLTESNLISEVRSIKDYAYLQTALVVENCFIIGDAAGFADPINSEGISMGMYSGYLAAWSIESILKSNNRSGFYKNIYKNNLQNRFKVFQLLSYPKEKVAPQLIESCKQIIRNQSVEETQLIWTHLKLMNRGKDFPELMAEMHVDEKHAVRSLPNPFETTVD